MKLLSVIVTFYLVILLTSEKCKCQDNQSPPSPTQDGSSGGPPQQPPPPAQSGDGSAPPPPGPPPQPPMASEKIFPTLKSWVDDILQRMASLTTELTPTPVDDAENGRKKKEGLDQLQGLEKGVKDPKLMANKNQRAIANYLTEVEEKLAGIGRRMFGIRWNTIPCGAGYIHANCGMPAACPTSGK